MEQGERVRILHVVTYMGIGGLETMLMNYYRSIDREKIQFDFLTHREFLGDYGEEILKMGGKIYHISRLNPFSKKYLKELDVFFSLHREYKIVHVHQDCLSSVILKQAKRNSINIRIAHSHASGQDINWKYLVKLYYKKFIPQYATHLFACSESAGRFMYGRNKFNILRNAICAEQYRYNIKERIKTRMQLDLKDAFIVGIVGRLSPVKNHSFLLDIFSEVIKRETKSHLLVIGEGELRSQIENKISRLNLQNKVTLLGIRSDISSLLQAIDVFVFPSEYEGLGLAAIEAQAAGLPCICSDRIPEETIITDLVHKVSLEDTPENWAKIIISHRLDQRIDTYQNIVNAGYDIRENACKLQQFYLEVLK